MKKGKELDYLIKIVHRCLLLFVFMFTRFVYQSNQTEPRRKQDSEELYDKIHQYVVTEKHFLDKNLKEKEVIKHCKIKKEQLRRVLRERCGLTFSEYIKKLRIDHACILLLDPNNILIEVISEMVCFNNSRTFDRCFKAWHNMTPSEYRRFHRLKSYV